MWGPMITIRNKRKHHKSKLAQAGFTLIEVAVALMIIGLVLGSVAEIYKQWVRYEQTETTRLNVQNAVNAITAYRDIYGRYPCPAPLTASRHDPEVGSAGDAIYGVSTDCTVTTGDYALGAGITQAGIARVNSTDVATYAYKDIDNPTAPPVSMPPVVRIGALPFRTLNLDEDQSYDGYRNKIFYAVTEQLTNRALFDPSGGGISIINDTDNSAIYPPGSAHFIIFSAGEDGAGAFSQGDTRLPCTGAGQQGDNCSIEADTVFRIAERGTSGDGTAKQFDDVVAYATHKDVPLWEQGADPTDPSGANMTMKVSGGVGIGETASQTPQEELEVQGIVRAQDDPNTPEIEGNVETSSICEYDSGNSTCFPSSLIAGDLEAGTGGMQCPAGTFMTGIKNNQPICSDEVIVECPGDQVMKGVNADGELICSGAPPGACATETVDVCGEQKTLFAGPHGTTRTVYAGASRGEEYHCQNGNWVLAVGWGLCECTPYVWDTYTTSCNDYSGGCGRAFTGTRTMQWDVTCPWGTWVNTTIDDSNCTCVESQATRQEDCPAGFNSGSVSYVNRHVCSGTPHCSGWIETGNTCSCSPTSETRTLTCPTGQTGSITQKRDFSCAGGSTNPGSWGSWTTTSNTCTCVSNEYTQWEDACPVGTVGQVQYKYTKECPNTTYTKTEVSNTCAVPPPVVCQWKIQGTGTTQNFPLTIKDGDVCDCGTEKGNSKSCTTAIGNGQHRLSNCICQ